MRVRTSITLSEALIKKIDRIEGNRPAFLERAAEAYLERLAKLKRDARELDILNRNAGRLNAEAMEVLETNTSRDLVDANS